MAIAANFPSIKPSLNLDFANVGRLDPRVTFARASTARYYDGVTTAKAEENLLVQSQDFTTTWSATSSTATANTEVAPDGTTTADTITASAGASTHQISQSVTTAATSSVLSVFAKAGTHNYIQLRFGASSGAQFCNFDITSGAGAVGTSSSATGTITDVGGGWYRCSIVATTLAASSSIAIFLVSSSSAAGAESWTAVGTETVYFWGAQQEQRSAVTAYTATTTQPITNYVPVLLTAQNGVPRFDHTPTTGAALGLEIEEQRTNLVTYSEDFANAAWTKTNSSITSNTIVAPDGALTGDKIVEDTANTSHFIGRNVTVTAASTLIYSIYAKAGERSVFNLRITDGVTGFARKFDVSNGTSDTEDVASTSPATVYGIESVGNGWYRCYVGCTMVSGTSSNIQFRLNNSGDVYTGDGYSGVFIWGAQLEAGAFATSYIPTTTTALTRSADAASMTGTNFSSWYNASEGTLFVQAITPPNLAGFPTAAYISDGSSQNIISHYLFTNGYYANVRSGNVDQGNAARLTAPVVGNVYKFAAGIKLNDANGAANGLIGTADTSLLMPVGVNQIRIGATQSGGAVCNTHIQKIAYYPVRLSDAQLQALTG